MKRLSRIRGGIASFRNSGPTGAVELAEVPLRSRKGIALSVAAGLIIVLAVVISIAPASRNEHAGRQHEATPSATPSFDPSVIGNDPAESGESSPALASRGVNPPATDTEAAAFVDRYVETLFSFDTSTETYGQFFSTQADAWAQVQSTMKPPSALDTMMEDLGYTQGQWARWSRDGRSRAEHVVRILWDDQVIGFVPKDAHSHVADVLARTTDSFLGKTETVDHDVVVTVVCPGSTLPGTHAITGCALWGVEVHQ